MERIFLASNCPRELKEDIQHLAKLHEIEVINTKENNEKLGIKFIKYYELSKLKKDLKDLEII